MSETSHDDIERPSSTKEMAETVNDLAVAAMRLGGMSVEAANSLDGPSRRHLIAVLEAVGEVAITARARLGALPPDETAALETAIMAKPRKITVKAEQRMPATAIAITDRTHFAIDGKLQETEPQKIDMLRLMGEAKKPLKARDLREGIAKLAGVILPSNTVGQRANRLTAEVNEAAGREVIKRTVLYPGNISERPSYHLDDSVLVSVDEQVDQRTEVQRLRYHGLYTAESNLSDKQSQPGESVALIIADNKLVIDGTTYKLGLHEIFILNVLREAGRADNRTLFAYGFYGSFKTLETSLGNLRRKLVRADKTNVIQSDGDILGAKYSINKLKFVENRAEPYSPWSRLQELGDIAQPAATTHVSRRATLAMGLPARRRAAAVRREAENLNGTTTSESLTTEIEPSGFVIEPGHAPELGVLYEQVITAADAVSEKDRQFGYLFESSVMKNSGQDRETVRGMMLMQRLHSELNFPLPGSLVGATTLGEHKKRMLSRANTLMQRIPSPEARGILAVMLGLPPAEEGMTSLKNIILTRTNNTNLSYEQVYATTTSRKRDPEDIATLLNYDPKSGAANLNNFYNQTLDQLLPPEHRPTHN
jgi:hypothetical protein